MKPYEREFLIGRICNGYLIYKSVAGYDLNIHPPTSEQNYQSSQIYQEAYNRAIIDDILTEEDVTELLRKEGLWNHASEQRVKEIRKDMDNLRVSIFRAAFKKDLQGRLRQNLRGAEKALTKLLYKKHGYTFATCEGYATAEQLKWIVEHTTKYTDGAPYDWKDDTVEQVVHFYHLNQIPDKDVRTIAKSSDWRSMWSCSKNEGRVFNKTGFEMTDDQKILMTYSMMYDSVHESMDCPSDDIIEDDDALDGWFIVQKRKRDQMAKEAKADDISGKHDGANEIFVMTTDNQQDVDSVYALNDPVSQGVVKGRFAQVEESKGKGGVKYQEFNDVKRDLQMEAAKQFSNTMK